MEGKNVRQASRRKYHYIYKTTCIVTNRYYIGMHSTDDLEDGYIGSGQRLWKSINKYGKENHIKEILEFLSNREDLKLRERALVNEEVLKDPMCMNLQLGGFGGFTDSAHYGKFSKGRIEGHKKGLETQRWLKENDEEWYRSYTTKLSQITKHRCEMGEFGGGFIGKNHSEETKSKMSEKAKLRTGDKNSQFNTCWIFNDETKQSIKIKNNELQAYLNLGWSKGRKMKF